MAPRRFAVVGGGLAGLAAARLLGAGGHAVDLFEAQPRLGGQILTLSEDACVVEGGAEGWAAGSGAVADFVASFAPDLVIERQRTLPSAILLNGRLDRVRSGEAAALLGIRAASGSGGLDAPREGTAHLIERLAGGLPSTVRVHRNRPARRLLREHRWVVETAGGPCPADAVMVCTPAAAAAALLCETAPEPAAQLTALPVRSSVTVSAAYARSAVAHPLDLSGLVVHPDTPSGDPPIAACTFVTSKFRHRAPADTALLRTFFRPASAGATAAPDPVWADAAHAFLTPILGLRHPPRRVWVHRWPDALPVHDAAGRAAVARVETALAAACPGLYLAGAAYRPGGIEGAIDSARSAVTRGGG